MPEILTFRQFCWKRGYDVEISHDRLRFPHGISKIQRRRNHAAALHHLGEAFRARQDYAAAVKAGEVRPPTASETHQETLVGHPDHAAVRAAWRVAVKRLLRVNPGLDRRDAVEALITELFGGVDAWMTALDSTLENQVAVRMVWMEKK